VAPALKQRDPTARIVLGGLSQVAPRHLGRVYNAAGRAAFDVVNIHLFAHPLAADGLRALKALCAEVRSVMAQHGDAAKPLWITEIGCPGIKDPRQTPPWWLGENLTEEQQAEWVERVYTACLDWEGVEKVFWAFFRDTHDHFGNGIDGFGLVRYDLSLKPSYLAYQKIALK
jgi:hypothetical protein